MPPEHPSLRPGTPADSYACFEIFWASIKDLAHRLGTSWTGTAQDAWPRFEDLYDLLARHAAEWWVAEGGDGLIGYARSLQRGSLFELTEFFVRTDRQSAGIGRLLLDRAFPPDRGEVRAIIATTDVRATARYLRSGTSIQFPIVGFTGQPVADASPRRLTPVRIEAGSGSLETVAAIERAVLGYDRGAELRWILERREGHLYHDADDQPVAFAFIGAGGIGPIAALEPEHQPDVLLHLEDRAARMGLDSLGFEVPGPNVIAMRHLLDRGFQVDPFLTLLMASRPFGRFDRYLGFTPPFVL